MQRYHCNPYVGYDSREAPHLIGLKLPYLKSAGILKSMASGYRVATV